ncbi:hypothetical protein PROFUN_01469 [Planoprotostelium fungivorum]|uniref:Uncharacterized protein n=1 Tax=Planoprotostelium fungivorum TaxID=1890364 RepID=A0A2P6NTB2_9EUKA|nr:hypothetical protein PROFUN_01469 [Planoprotostelium fungivorum]
MVCPLSVPKTTSTREKIRSKRREAAEVVRLYTGPASDCNGVDGRSDVWYQEEVLLEGYLFKQGGGKFSSAWQRRYCVLKSGSLTYFKDVKDAKVDKQRPQGAVYPLTEYELLEEGSYFSLHPKNNTFVKDRVYRFRIDEGYINKDWVNILKRIITQEVLPSKGILDIQRKLGDMKIEIPPDDLRYSTVELGKGASGTVIKGTWNGTTDVAIKVMNDLSEFLDEEELKSFYREIEMLSQLRHPEVVTMYGYSIKKGVICLVTEFVPGGTLAEIELDPLTTVTILMAIASGMVFLHKKKIVHRDLKPANVLIENLSKGQVKVCDFGLSMVGQSTSETVYGTPQYAAPELPTAGANEKVDVYSFAIIMWELCARQTAWKDTPFGSDIAMKVKSAIRSDGRPKRDERLSCKQVQGGERPPIVPGFVVMDIITDCWDPDPAHRLSFEAIWGRLSTMSNTMKTLHFQQQAAVPGSPNLSSSRYPVSASPRSSISYNPGSPTLMRSTIRSMTIEEKIEADFGSNKTMEWIEFTHMGAKKSDVEAIRFCLVNGDGEVPLAQWSKFIDWFSPLEEDNNYFVYESARNDYGYKLSEIASIAGMKSFFGHFSVDDSRKILSSFQTDGCYLFRFSGQVGYYTLSAIRNQVVYHWRISTEKTHQGILFKYSDKEAFPSLEAVVLHYKTHQLPAGNNGEDGFFLSHACNRNNAFQYSTEYKKPNRAKKQPQATFNSDVKQIEHASTFRVDWESENEKPINWPKKRKWWLTLQIALLLCVSMFGSSIFTQGSSGVSDEFQVTMVTSSLTTAIYVLGYGTGGLFWPPLSDVPHLGRNIVYQSSLFIYLCLQIGVARTTNFRSLLVLRFFSGVAGGAPLSVCVDSMHDICLLGIFVAAGPLLGPVIGNFVYERLGFRWLGWVLLFSAATFQLITLFCMRETQSDHILLVKAREKRRETDDPRYLSQIESEGTSWFHIAKELVTPFRMLSEPIVVISSLLTALPYGLLYFLFEAVLFVYIRARSWTFGQSGLVFLSILVGAEIGPICTIIFEKTYYEPLYRKMEGQLAPEERLYPAMVSIPLYTISFFWFAWTGSPQHHWVSSVISLSLYGVTTVIQVPVSICYLSDVYKKHASAAFVRSIMGTTFAIVVFPIFQNLGNDWAPSLVGFLTLITLPLPFVLYKWGPKMRQNREKGLETKMKEFV